MRVRSSSAFSSFFMAGMAFDNFFVKFGMRWYEVANEMDTVDDPDATFVLAIGCLPHSLG